MTATAAAAAAATAAATATAIATATTTSNHITIPNRQQLHIPQQNFHRFLSTFDNKSIHKFCTGSIKNLRPTKQQHAMFICNDGSKTTLSDVRFHMCCVLYVTTVTASLIILGHSIDITRKEWQNRNYNILATLLEEVQNSWHL